MTLANIAKKSAGRKKGGGKKRGERPGFSLNGHDPIVLKERGKKKNRTLYCPGFSS